MNEDLQMQKRYFSSKLEKYRKKPDIHRELIRDCEYYLDMLDEVASPGEFKRKVRRTGNMLSTAKADALDRYGNRAAVYDALGQARKAEEERERLTLIESVETHNDLSVKLEGFENNTRKSYNENLAMNALGSVIKSLFHLCTDPPRSKDRERSLANFREYWRQMKEADPDVSWEKITDYPAYRDRIVFTDRQMSILEETFREVCHG